MTSPGESTAVSDAYIEGEFAGTLPFRSLLTYYSPIKTESSSDLHAPPPPPPYSFILPPKKAQKGQRLAEKARILQSQLPIETARRLDVATVLEETCKYIKFLTAQIRVLNSMPPDLERREVVEAVVNSKAAQAEMYSRGCCVYSVDQLVFMKENANRVAAFHQLMLSNGGAAGSSL